ncbi:MAG TPA: DUF4190 domain-containing protein [Pirellulaceae bacterium]|nr:DUF4190 domain-containing protein [Pirellulaceae bacterium]
MQCTACGANNPDHVSSCLACGSPMQAGGARPGGGAPNPFAEQRPYAPPQYAPRPPNASDDNAALRFIVPVQTSGWSIAAGYLGLLSLGCCILGPFAVFTGVMGLREIAAKPGLGGQVRCIVGIVLGALGTIGLIGLGVTFVAS